ncbi:hypothetical protein HZA97_07440 [Candidatus Woesearchaeota archaeon]|nr:hypothetical protein [Candidatus Woesearchaeota archaeon]
MQQNILGDKKKTSFDENLADIVNAIYDNKPEEQASEKTDIKPAENGDTLIKIEKKKDSSGNLMYIADYTRSGCENHHNPECDFARFLAGIQWALANTMRYEMDDVVWCNIHAKSTPQYFLTFIGFDNRVEELVIEKLIEKENQLLKNLFRRYA